jgi:hypothetical protein
MLVNPAPAVYGLITVGALLSAESAKRQTYGETVAGVVLALLIFWMAHSYSEFTARRLEEGAKLRLTDLARTMGQQLSILAGAAVPLAIVLVWWITSGSLTGAVAAAVWVAAGMIVIVETLAALGAHLSGRALAGQIALGAVLGLLVVALNFVLH